MLAHLALQHSCTYSTPCTCSTPCSCPTMCAHYCPTTCAYSCPDSLTLCYRVCQMLVSEDTIMHACPLHHLLSVHCSAPCACVPTGFYPMWTGGDAKWPPLTSPGAVGLDARVVTTREFLSNVAATCHKFHKFLVLSAVLGTPRKGPDTRHVNTKLLFAL